MMFGSICRSDQCDAAHYVQLYSDDIRPLASNVGRYLAEGLSRGEPALVIAAPEHAEAFIQALGNSGCDVPEAIRTGWLVMSDAAEVLAQLMVKVSPDWKRFEKTVGVRIQRLRGQTGASRVRAYGEMVGLLWNDGRSAAALCLEEFWNRLLAAGDLTLFCAYQIDVFGPEFQEAVAGRILAAHSAMVSGLDEEFGRAIDRAALEVMRVQPGRTEGETVIPRAESEILWLRSRHPEWADEVLTRARAAMDPVGSTSRDAPSLATSPYPPG